MKNSITILFSPSELAVIRKVQVSEIFKQIRNNTLAYQMTDDGIKIPITYYFT